MKQVISTQAAPKVIGAYSQGIKAGNMVYLSGQIPLIPETMVVVEGDFQAQAHQVFRNLLALAEASGGSLSHIVKLTIYLTDLKYFDVLNEVLKEYFDLPYPARAVIEVSGLPKNVDIEVESILFLGE